MRVRSGQLEVTVALGLSEYLVKEQDFLPWCVALDNLGYIRRLLDEKPSYKYYKVSRWHAGPGKV